MQSVSGLHSGTNPISGDFSVGAEGLMVRDGEFAEPVREVTIASTLQRMLLDIAEVGADLTFLPGAVAGMTVLVGEMTISGASAARYGRDAAAVEDRVELGERVPRVLAEVHGLHAVRARGRDVVGVVVDEHRLGRRRSPMRAHVSS